MSGIKNINKYFKPMSKDEWEVQELKNIHSARIAREVSIDSAIRISTISTKVMALIDLVDDVEDEEEAITKEVNLVGYSSDDDENDVEDEVVFIEAVVQKPKSSVGDAVFIALDNLIGGGPCTVQDINIEPQRNKDKGKKFRRPNNWRAIGEYCKVFCCVQNNKYSYTSR